MPRCARGQRQGAAAAVHAQGSGARAPRRRGTAVNRAARGVRRGRTDDRKERLLGRKIQGKLRTGALFDVVDMFDLWSLSFRDSQGDHKG